MQRFDQWLQYGLFGLLTDNGVIPPGGVAVHQSYGTTGASYSPEVGNPQGNFYPGQFRNPSDQSSHVIAQGTVISMGPQTQRGGRMSFYNIIGSTFQNTSKGMK